MIMTKKKNGDSDTVKDLTAHLGIVPVIYFSVHVVVLSVSINLWL